MTCSFPVTFLSLIRPFQGVLIVFVKFYVNWIIIWQVKQFEYLILVWSFKELWEWSFNWTNLFCANLRCVFSFLIVPFFPLKLFDGIALFVNCDSKPWVQAIILNFLNPDVFSQLHSKSQLLFYQFLCESELLILAIILKFQSLFDHAYFIPQKPNTKVYCKWSRVILNITVILFHLTS